jgi:hypothetical protein
MIRLGLVLVLILGACSDNGSATAKATLTGAEPAVQSCYSKPFKLDDGSGNLVLGWNIVMVSNAVGAGCKEDTLKIVSTVGIYTSQAPNGSAVATLTIGDYTIVPVSPPNVIGPATVDMTVTGVSNINGDLSLTGIDKSADGKTTIGLEGTVTSAGTDSLGNAVSLNGTFSAPVCTD